MSTPFNPFLNKNISKDVPPVAASPFISQNIGQMSTPLQSPPMGAYPSAIPPPPMSNPMIPTNPMSMAPPMTNVNQLQSSFQNLSLNNAPPMVPPPPTNASLTQQAPPMSTYPSVTPNRYGLPDTSYQYGSQMNQMSTNQYMQTPDVPSYSQPAYGAAPVYETKAEVDPSSIPDSKYVQTSLETCPNTPAMLDNSGLTFSGYFRPLASPDYENEVPIIPLSSNNMIRCDTCRAYINPFVTFMESGHKWKCNLCYNINTVPPNYYCDTDMNGRRLDIEQHPELLKGQCEFEVSQEYMTRPPQSPTYFFVIDVSYQAVSTGMLAVTCQAIKDSLDDLKQKGGDISSFVGFITFDNTVQLYTFKPQTGVEVHVVGDLDEPFLPVPTSLVVSVEEYYNEIVKLLDNLPTMYRQNTVVDSCLGSAIAYTNSIMEDIGGKVLLFQGCLPNIGKFNLHNRESINIYGTDKEKDLLNPVNTAFSDFLASYVANKQFCYDLYVCSSQYTDVSTLSTIPKCSGGQFYYYPNFKSENNMSECLYNDITHNLRRENTWEAVLRIRTPISGEIKNYYGNCLLRSNGLIVAPCINSDSVFQLDFAFKENIVTPHFYIQAALLYSTSTKSRRIRVFTTAIPITSLLSTVFEKINCEVYANHLFRQTIEASTTLGLTVAREKLHQKLVTIVNKYAPYRDPNTAAFLPASLSMLPLYVMSLQKHPSFRGGNDIRADMRTFLYQSISLLSPENTPVFLYPRLMCLTSMEPFCCTYLEEGKEAPEGYSLLPEDNFILPPITSLSAQAVLPQHVYLLDDGMNFYIYFGANVTSDIYTSILGIPSPEGYDLSQAFFPILETELNEKIHTLIDRLRQDRPYFTPLYIVTNKDQVLLNRFVQRLIEDKAPFNGGNYSYPEYVQLLGGKNFKY